MKTKKIKKIVFILGVLNFFILNFCNAQLSLVRDSVWRTVGNSTTWSGSNACRNSLIGPKNCVELDAIAGNIKMISLIPNCLACQGGKNKIVLANFDTLIFDYGSGGIDAFYKSGSIAGEKYTGTTKGKSIIASGTSSIAVLSIDVNATGNIDRIACKATAVPASGFGTGLFSTGGSLGVYGYGKGDTYGGPLPVYGIYGYAKGPTGAAATYRYGIYGRADTAHAAYGVFGIAFSSNSLPDTSRAGYFSGNLEYTGTFSQPSDEKLKENIVPFSGALEKLNMLNAVSYNYKTEFNFMHLARGKQIGLLAQNLEKVFPELVLPSIHPAIYAPGTEEKISDEVNYKSVNYLGLIPVIVKGVNEQQEEINQLRSENAELKSQMAEIQNSLLHLSGNELKKRENNKPLIEQNIPNPFTEKTVIKYFIPNGTVGALINIYTIDRKLLKSYPVSSGNGIVNVDAGSLSPGSYFYELVVDTKIVDTKAMSLTK